MADAVQATGAANAAEKDKALGAPRLYFDWRVLLPLASLALALLVHMAVPSHPAYKVRQFPYYTYLLILLLVVYGVLGVISVFNGKQREKLAFKSWFLGAGFLLLNLYNLITIKLNLIPSLYFPAPERIVRVFAVDWLFILRCLVYSLRLGQ